MISRGDYAGAGPRRRPEGRISRLRWADGSGLRGSRSGVRSAEIEEVLRWDPYLRTDGSRTLAYGATSHGRFLLVVLRLDGPGDLRVVAAREMTEREREATRVRPR